ncbi:MAG TPA: hypothetical protein ENI74_03055, partial [Gammaproteobacteria bacterium]|nr:hypothetical protein [Gammaproteobacteria bacterium]
MTTRPNMQLLALALLANICSVSLCLADSPAAPREFEIELLVFQNLVANDAGEVWPVDYSEWFEEPDAESTAVNPAPTEINWLPEQDYRLTAERNALSRSTRYRPLAYF